MFQSPLDAAIKELERMRRAGDVRYSVFDRPLDAVLYRMRVRGLRYAPHPERVDTWTGQCASCGRESLTLTEHGDGGNVSLTCDEGCHEGWIVDALGGESTSAGDSAALDLADDVAVIAENAVGVAKAAIDGLSAALGRVAELEAMPDEAGV